MEFKDVQLSKNFKIFMFDEELNTLKDALFILNDIYQFTNESESDFKNYKEERLNFRDVCASMIALINGCDNDDSNVFREII